MNYILCIGTRTSGLINAINFDLKHSSQWGDSGNHGEDYGIRW